MSVAELARRGLREMPSNAAWLMSRALKPAEALGAAAEPLAAGARDRGRKVASAVVDAAPLGGDSVDIRMRRAREAAERAEEAEARAIEAARESTSRSDHARTVIERGRAQVKEVDREAARIVKQRVTEAHKATNEWIRRETEAAEADAEERRQAVRVDIEGQIEAAQREADACQQQAEELVEDAAERRAEARRLAGEAAQAARATAEAANRQAQELARQAALQSDEAMHRVEVSEQLRQDAQAPPARSAAHVGEGPSNGDLKAYTKPELVDLAAVIGIDHRTTMTKSELVDAITNASRSRT